MECVACGERYWHTALIFGLDPCGHALCNHCMISIHNERGPEPFHCPCGSRSECHYFFQTTKRGRLGRPRLERDLEIPPAPIRYDLSNKKDACRSFMASLEALTPEERTEKVGSGIYINVLHHIKPVPGEEDTFDFQSSSFTLSAQGDCLPSCDDEKRL